MAGPTIVFVHLGHELPSWLSQTLQQARTFNSGDIVLIAEAVALAAADLPATLRISRLTVQELGVSEKHRLFRQISTLDRQFRNGFWTFTSERFFVIETAVQKLALQDIVHLENDILLYCSVEQLVPKLSRLYPNIAATFDNDQRCVPGIVYFPHGRAIATVTDFYLHVLRQMAASGNGQPVNDMQMLGALRREGRQIIDHLPIVPPDYPAPLRSAAGHSVEDPRNYSRHFDALGYIFDAAALGQFLGGVDPRNGPGPSIGFINESCVFDPRLLRPRMSQDACGRRVPVVETVSGVHSVANLHVHSKNLTPFLSV